MKTINKIALLALGLSLFIGSGLAISYAQKDKALEANAATQPSNPSWDEVTSLEDINTVSYYVIATNQGTGYLDGTLKSGHFQSTTFTSTSPSSTSASGVIQMEKLGTNKYAMKLVSTDKYITATDASTKHGSVSETSDEYGWLFSYSDGFNAIYQKSFSNKYACLRYYDSDFRTYQATNSTTPATLGKSFKMYRYVVDDDVLDGISLSGSLRTQHAGTNWNTDGLLVTAHWQIQGDLNVTPLATFSFNPAKPALGVDSVEITASYEGKSATATFSVNVIESTVYRIVEDATELKDGTTFYIVAKSGDKYYIANNDLTAGHIVMQQITEETSLSGLTSGSTLISSEGRLLTLVGSAGNWQITDGTNYLAFSGTSNGNDSFESSNKDKSGAKFTITSDGLNVLINNNSYSGRGYRYNTQTGDLRNYETTKQTALYMFADIPADIDETAVEFAQLILDDITCDSTGVTPPDTGDWEALEELYEDVTAEGKEALLNSPADSSIVITSVSSDADILKAAMAKYDYIVGKYGKATYADFIGRDPSPILGTNHINLMMNNNYILPIVIISSITALSAVGLFFILRKKKHQQ